ncbi:transcription factor IBH1-like [Sesamum indicum]|uniref:Transcription factor IBH1-like n=1 Tax=Sesamum indicum TaxID=4182 RepID=A0A6I9TVI7_SESIN|nr:transcription factor IBH1-like [Sesamum indicum]
MKTAKNLHTNPTSIKNRFSLRFLRAINKLNNNIISTPPPLNPADRRKRYHAIRAAAYASMALAVGPNKAWSRAVLRKIRNRTKEMIKPRTRRGAVGGSINPRNELGLGQENELRERVPGGEAMDFRRLLNETGHYIQCLRAQVQVMRKILHYSST